MKFVRKLFVFVLGLQVPVAQVAEKFGCSESTVHQWLNKFLSHPSTLCPDLSAPSISSARYLPVDVVDHLPHKKLSSASPSSVVEKSSTATTAAFRRQSARRFRDFRSFRASRSLAAARRRTAGHARDATAAAEDAFLRNARRFNLMPPFSIERCIPTECHTTALPLHLSLRHCAALHSVCCYFALSPL